MISALALFSAYRNPRQSLGKRCGAFDDTMIHGELQFTRLITVCHDLHRRRSLGIHFTYSNVDQRTMVRRLSSKAQRVVQKPELLSVRQLRSILKGERP